MRIIFWIIIFYLNWSFVWGQTVEKSEPDLTQEEQEIETYFSSCCKQESSYEGGDKAFYRDLNKNLQYPRRVRKIKGETYLIFTVSRQGKIINPKIEKSLGQEYDKMILKALEQTSQNWAPAKDKKGKTCPEEKKVQIIFNKRKFKIMS